MKLRLRAGSMEQLDTALVSAGLVFTDPISNQPYYHSSVTILDYPLRKATGEVVFDEETGCEVHIYEALPGYHANVLTGDPEVVVALSSLLVYPNTPLVEWAGVP